MSPVDFQALTHQVLWLAFGLSAGLGALTQATHFCSMGAINDVVHLGDWQRARQWALAAAVAIFGFALLRVYGGLDAGKTIYAGDRLTWASSALGGALFGFGMVLASGCGAKMLVRIGSGNLKAVVVFAVMAPAAFATLRGLTAVLRTQTVDQVYAVLPTQASLPGWLQAAGLGADAAALGPAAALGGALAAWALLGRDFLRTGNLMAGLGVGAAVTAMWWASGVHGHVFEHPETLEDVFVATNSGRIEALSFVSPVAYAMDWLLFFSDQSKRLTVGIVSVLGVVVGSWMVAWRTGRFRWEGFASREDLANHLVGAMLMGVGGVTALGCTIGQGLSGLSTLSFNSLIAVAAIVAGAVAALRYQTWRLERQA